MPLLEEVLGGSAAVGLARTAELLRSDDEALEQWAERYAVAPGDEIDVAEVGGLPPAVLSRVLRRWLLDGGVSNPTRAHLVAVSALVNRWNGQGPVAVGGWRGPDGAPQRLVVERRRGKLLLTTRDPAADG